MRVTDDEKEGRKKTKYIKKTTHENHTPESLSVCQQFELLCGVFFSLFTFVRFVIVMWCCSCSVGFKN